MSKPFFLEKYFKILTAEIFTQHAKHSQKYFDTSATYDTYLIVWTGPSDYHHYENTPIQIYRKFHLQKLKIFR